eukprot:1239099-Rhodomonas_salina.1
MSVPDIFNRVAAYPSSVPDSATSEPIVRLQAADSTCHGQPLLGFDFGFDRLQTDLDRGVAPAAYPISVPHIA